MRMEGRIKTLEKKIIPSGPNIICAETKEEAEKKKREALRDNPNRELIVIIAPRIEKYGSQDIPITTNEDFLKSGEADEQP